VKFHQAERIVHFHEIFNVVHAMLCFYVTAKIRFALEIFVIFANGATQIAVVYP